MSLTGERTYSGPIGTAVACPDTWARTVLLEELATADGAWRLAFDAVPDLIAVLDTRLRLVRVNRALAERLACDPDGLVGERCHECVHRQGKPRGYCPVARLLDRHENAPAEGSEEWLDDFIVTASPIRDDAGQIVGIVHTMREATQTIALQRSLREHDDLQTRFADAYEDLAFIKDGAGRYLMVNDANAAFFHLSKEEIVGRTDFELMPVKMAERCRRTDIEAMEGNGLCVTREEVDGRTYEARKFGVDLGEAGTAVGGLVRDVTEARGAAKALAESEQRFRALFDQAPLGYQSLDAEGHIVEVNQAWLDLLGYSRAEVIGRWFGDFLEPDQMDLFRARFPLFKQTGKARSMELLMRRADGRPRLMSFDGSVGHQADGGYSQTHYILNDVTERRAAEEDLTRSEDRFRTLFENSINGIALHEMVYDESGEAVDYVFVTANPAFTTLTGLEVQDVIGKPATQVLPGVRETGLIEQYARVVATGEPTRFEAFVEPLGRHFDIAAFCPSPRTLATVFSDVSPQKLSTELLAASEEKFRLAMEAARIGIVDWNVPSGDVYYSPGYAEMLGYRRDHLEPTHTEWEHRIHDEDRDKVLGPLQEHLLGKTERFESEYRLRRNDGSWVCVQELARVVERDADGSAVRCVGTISDISIRRRAETDLQTTTERLRRTVAGTVAALGAAVESKDPYTAGHERRVAELACAIAVQLGFDEAAVEGLRLAATMHDLGKLSVPTEILSKPGRLADIEMTLVRQHAQVGRDIIAGIEFDRPVADIVWQHHERLDGSGYPRALRDDQILPEARVLAVADVVEAMVSHRPYRPGLPISEALDEIAAGAGVLYDADVCAACRRLFLEMDFAFCE